MYSPSPSPGPVMPPDAPVETSANSWRALQMYNASRGRGFAGVRSTAVRLAGGVVIYPSFSRMQALGDDTGGVDWVDTYSDPLGGAQVAGIVAAGGLAPATQDVSMSFGPSPFADSTLPTTQDPNAFVETNVVPDVSAGVASAGLTAAQLQQLIAAGATAAQIAAAQSAAAKAPVAAAPSIVAGVSNTTLLLGGAIVLMVLASSGKKR